MTSPLRQSRADALRIAIANRHGELVLDRSTYRCLAEDGWSRGAIDQAIDDLVELGDVAIVAGSGPLYVRSLEDLSL
jgi:hypothetical protein